MRLVYLLIIAAGLLMGTGAAFAQAPAAQQELASPAMRYEQDYPLVGYSNKATRNCFARLQSKLDQGELQLAWDPAWGYLPSLLKALDIGVDSQVLVFSKTSLQTHIISAATPRAFYFNDDCYVAHVHGSTFMELTAIDADLGTVFYGLENQQQLPPKFGREGGRCLTCHDTYSMTGGGVPRVLAMSAPVASAADDRRNTSASEVNDRTPVAMRWGGWYVTGQHGRQTHLGNLPLRDESRQSEALKTLSPANRQTLAGYFDTSTYLSDRSDIVALLVLEHQAYLQNLMVRVSFKLRSGRTRTPQSLAPLIEPLVKALFFEDAATLADTIVGSTRFSESFTARGPADSRQRSLRQFDLGKHLFRYPLSYMVYSEAFENLPAAAHEYLDARIAEILVGSDTSGIAARIPAADRQAVREILSETHPRLARALAGAPAAGSR
jgi:hypothetical protein